jgi:hypothetical protein
VTHYIDVEDYLSHIGQPRRSGRYPWGSGENPYQRNASFLGTIDRLRKEGMTEAEIAKSQGMNTSQLRAAKSIAKNANRQADISQAERLKERGWSNVAIGERMGMPESSVRALLAPGAKHRADVLQTTANILKDEVGTNNLIDVGVGIERHLSVDQQMGVSQDRLKTAVSMLEHEGYKIHYIPVEQLGTGHKTSLKVLAPPGMTYSEVYKNRHKVRPPAVVSQDRGETFDKIRPPQSVDSKRVDVRYSEDGGAEADGVIYVRPGVEDVSLGASNYAQVRIAVDGTHYLKGMAVYADNLPPGKDLVFNTNKSRADVSSHKEAMKALSDDPENPFGSSIARQHGVMNVLREEGDWAQWSNTLSSQVLSKQSPKLAKQQLDLKLSDKQSEFEEIKSLTNPAIKTRLLESFSDDADSSAVHLQAAALPRQKGHHVILPVSSMRDTEIYAPKFRNGERVVLVRHPHGGIFEIPELTVNNRQPEARKLLGTQPSDAVAINSRVAERLSGADFDGDTVLVISNEQNRVKTSPPLEGLKNFDPKTRYPGYEGMPKMSPAAKQQQMGDVSNLITDMTIKGASQSELARAVRHSMVVIDAEKHNLNHKLSAQENRIAELKEKYQGSKRGGAATLVSRASSREDVPARKPRPASQGGPIDPETGRLVFVPTGETRTDKRGRVQPRMERSTKARETDDAHTLSSGTPIERVYADHSNKLKGLANEARKELVKTPAIVRSPSAARTYANEVATLDAKLNVALMNAPKERHAQVIANEAVRKKIQARPDLEPSEVKKLKGQELEKARARIGASKQRIDITPSEWEAIQSGAISQKKMVDILNNTDLDHIKKLATPKSSPTLTPAREARMRAMANAGYTQAEIADALGVGTSTVSNVLA